MDLLSDRTVTEAVITQVATDIHATNLSKGFWEAPETFLAEINTKLLLIVDEVSEATKVLREHYPGIIHPYSRMTPEQGDDFIEELADVIIRTLDLAQYFEGVHLSIGPVILQKMEKNRGRPQKHGKRF